MADKEDSVHIKIKLDVSDEDKQFTEKLSQDLEKADQQGIKAKRKTATNQEKIGPPTKTEFEIRELEKQIDEIEKRRKLKKGNKTTDQILEEKQQKLNTLHIKEFNEGPLGDLKNLSEEAANNLVKIATKPASFIAEAVFALFGKVGKAAARGGIFGIIALVVYEAVLFFIKQLMEPGRLLDRRFRRIARVETMNFYERTLQEELRHGYQEIRVTTIQGLRGGESQVNGNFFEFSSGATGILQSSPYRSSQQVYGHAYLSGSGIDRRGNPRRRTVSGRFG